MQVQAQVSVYSLSNYHKMKTLTYSANDDFVQVQFCGDPKFLACMTGEKDRKVVIFLWEKDKVHKEIDLSQHHITRMRVAPCTTLMITTSGKGIMRSWFFGLGGLIGNSRV
jgi:predicted mannosyl-3-phosphoglycerate phosphatase (HAD superfamily)